MIVIINGGMGMPVDLIQAGLLQTADNGRFIICFFQLPDQDLFQQGSLGFGTAQYYKDIIPSYLIFFPCVCQAIRKTVIKCP